VIGAIHKGVRLVFFVMNNDPLCVGCYISTIKPYATQNGSPLNIPMGFATH
jgi:hypothetical protein